MVDTFENDEVVCEELEVHINNEDIRSKMYDEESSLLVNDVLISLGYDYMTQRFEDLLIDFDAFLLLETPHIISIFSDYPLGAAIKFQKAYNEWKSTNKFGEESKIDKDDIKVCKGIVKYIFDETAEGQAALSKMNIDRKIDTKSELLVCQTIASFFISNKVELSMNDIIFLAEQIEESFIHEVSTSYFDKKTKRGPLYDKYHNSLRSVRAHMPNSSSKKAKLDNNTATTSKQFYDEEEVQSNDFVKVASNNIDMDIFVQHWIKSSKIRTEHFRRNRDLLFTSMYPLLKRPDGYILINHDFEYLFPQKHFQQNWNNNQEELIQILKRDINHEGVKSLLDRINDVSNNRKILAILLGLSCHLHGTKHSFGEKKNIYKPTIYDTFNSLILIISQESQLDVEWKKYSDELKEKNLTQQAIIIAFGNSVEDISNKFCIVVEDMKFMFNGSNSLLRALESCLKIYHVFDLEYPTISHSLYSFLSTKFLEIQSKKSTSNKVTRLLNSFAN